MQHKRFARFRFEGQLLDDARQAIDVTSAATGAKIKFADNTTADLVVEKVEGTEGRYILTATGESQRNWLIGKARFDAYFAFSSGAVYYSKTQDVTIQMEVTPLPDADDLVFDDD